MAPGVVNLSAIPPHLQTDRNTTVLKRDVTAALQYAGRVHRYLAEFEAESASSIPMNQRL